MYIQEVKTLSGLKGGNRAKTKILTIWPFVMYKLTRSDGLNKEQLTGRFL